MKEDRQPRNGLSFLFETGEKQYGAYTASPEEKTSSVIIESGLTRVLIFKSIG